MTDYRLIRTAVIALCALGALASVWPVLDLIVPAVLAVAGATAWVVSAIRRELQIRRRLADPRIRHARQETHR
jgi:hypothetical protein